jgi:hypothetical protein
MYKGVDFNKKHYLNSYIYKLYILLKGKQKPYNHPIKPSKHNLELIYSNILGPLLIKGYNNS